MSTAHDITVLSFIVLEIVLLLWKETILQQFLCAHADQELGAGRSIP